MVDVIRRDSFLIAIWQRGSDTNAVTSREERQERGGIDKACSLVLVFHVSQGRYTEGPWMPGDLIKVNGGKQLRFEF